MTSTIKGVAPHANIIGYDVCDGGCQGYSIVASIEQAIIDGVDVINYSIGSSAAVEPVDRRRRRGLPQRARRRHPRRHLRRQRRSRRRHRSAAPATCRG